MTGNDASKDQILEIGIIVADKKLESMIIGPTVILKCS